MNAQTFNPHVRFIQKRTVFLAYPKIICAYDYRMFYIDNGNLSVEFTDHTQELVQGDLITIPPGVPYRLLINEKQPPVYYVINFDFDSDHAQAPPHNPQPMELFNRADIFSTQAMSPFEDILLLHNMEHLVPVLAEIYSESKKSNTNSTYITSALMKYLLSKIIVVAQKSQDTTPTSDLVDGVKKYINQHFNLELSNRQIATQFGYHPYYLSSLFRKYEGSTMHQYIASVRMQKARELLLSTNKTVYEIAEECGFSGASYFSEFFMKHQRITPTEYRERCK